MYHTLIENKKRNVIQIERILSNLNHTNTNKDTTRMRLNQLFKPLRSQIPATDFPNMQVKSWDQREDRDMRKH